MTILDLQQPIFRRVSDFDLQIVKRCVLDLLDDGWMVMTEPFKAKREWVQVLVKEKVV